MLNEREEYNNKDNKSGGLHERINGLKSSECERERQ